MKIQGQAVKNPSSKKPPPKKQAHEHTVSSKEKLSFGDVLHGEPRVKSQHTKNTKNTKSFANSKELRDLGDPYLEDSSGLQASPKHACTLDGLSCQKDPKAYKNKGSLDDQALSMDALKELQELQDPQESLLTHTGTAADSMCLDAQVQATGVEEVEPKGGLEPELVQVLDKMVEACFVGRQEQAKRVVMMDVVVPGRGRLRIRLKRGRQGVEVRFRAESKELSELLLVRKSELVDQAREKGVALARVEVA